MYSSILEIVIALMILSLAVNQRILNTKLNEIRQHLGISDFEPPN